MATHAHTQEPEKKKAPFTLLRPAGPLSPCLSAFYDYLELERCLHCAAEFCGDLELTPKDRARINARRDAFLSIPARTAAEIVAKMIVVTSFGDFGVCWHEHPFWNEARGLLGAKEA